MTTDTDTVLERTLREQGHGDARPRHPYEYHVTDLLRKPAAWIAEKHAMEDAGSGIDPWLSARGNWLEDGVLSSLPGSARNQRLRWNSADAPAYTPDHDFTIVGHPDGLSVELPDDGMGETIRVVEVKSQLKADDVAREDQALEQALSYAALWNHMADPVSNKALRKRQEKAVLVTEIEVVLAGQWDGDSRLFPVDDNVVKDLWLYLREKAAATAVAEREIRDGRTDVGQEIAEEFDKDHPPRQKDESVAWTPPSEEDARDALERWAVVNHARKILEDVEDALQAQVHAYQAENDEKRVKGETGKATRIRFTQDRWDFDALDALFEERDDLVKEEVQYEKEQDFSRVYPDEDEIRGTATAILSTLFPESDDTVDSLLALAEEGDE